MLSPLVPHHAFQEQLRAELLRCYPNPAEDLLPWAQALRSVWTMTEARTRVRRQLAASAEAGRTTVLILG